MNTFIGNIEARLDGKGRVFIPATYLYERQHRQLARQSKAPQKVTNFFGDPALPAAPKREKQQEKINILK